MSTAPSVLLDLRAYLSATAGAGLDQFGIVGNAAHTRGYHLGRDRIYSAGGLGDDDYSVQRWRDRNALSNYASALDIKFGSNYTLLRSLSIWLVERCKSGAPDCDDIREVIYSPDGLRVVRWDREGLPGGAADSHLYHTHISYYRDSVTRDQTAPYRIYFTGGQSEMQITAQVRQSWTPTVTNDRSNGVLRSVPDRKAPIVHRIAANEALVTVAEIRTIDGPDGNWRLVEWPGRDVLFALRSDLIAGAILSEPIDSGFAEGFNAAMEDMIAFANDRKIP